jgi:hypothetical protein
MPLKSAVGETKSRPGHSIRESEACVLTNVCKGFCANREFLRKLQAARTRVVNLCNILRANGLRRLFRRARAGKWPQKSGGGSWNAAFTRQRSLFERSFGRFCAVAQLTRFRRRRRENPEGIPASSPGCEERATLGKYRVLESTPKELRP